MDNPYIIKYYKSFPKGDYLYLIFEYINDLKVSNKNFQENINGLDKNNNNYKDKNNKLMMKKK